MSHRFAHILMKKLHLFQDFFLTLQRQLYKQPQLSRRLSDQFLAGVVCQAESVPTNPTDVGSLLSTLAADISLLSLLYAF